MSTSRAVCGATQWRPFSMFRDAVIVEGRYKILGVQET